jgi:hypothetical protein
MSDKDQWEGRWKELGAFGGVWLRLHQLKRAGQANQGHRHNFDHVTIVATGGVRCEVEGREPVEVKAPAILEIAASLRHKFTALADNTTYYCVYAVRDGDGRVTGEFDGASFPYTHACDSDGTDPGCTDCPALSREG